MEEGGKGTGKGTQLGYERALHGSFTGVGSLPEILSTVVRTMHDALRATGGPTTVCWSYGLGRGGQLPYQTTA